MSLVTMPAYHDGHPSLALASLCAYLRAHGIAAVRHEFNVTLDTSAVTPLLREAYDDRERFLQLIQDSASGPALVDTCVSEIRRNRPQVVGFSVVSTNTLLSILVARRLKQVAPPTRIVFGGPECDYRKNARFLIRTGWVDAVVLGEGEETLHQLVERFSRDERGPCPGALVRNGDEILDGGIRSAQLEMDQLPLPDYTDYVGASGMIQLAVAFNRGCVGRCRYCFESRYWRAYRQMSPERAVDTLASLRSTTGVSNYVLNQCLVNADVSWVAHFCDEIVARALDVRWQGNARIHASLDESLLRKMHQAGCRGLLFGVESASQPVLDKMRKRTTVAHGRRVLRQARACGIWVHVYWMLGFPGETSADLARTLDFILDEHAHIDSHGFHVFQLYKGTPLDEAWGTSEPAADPLDAEYQHWRTGEEVKSQFYLEHATVIADLATVMNALSIPMPPELAIIEDVRRMKRKQTHDLFVLFTVLLLRRALDDERLMDELASARPTADALVGVYRGLVEERGLAHDVRAHQDDLVARVVADGNKVHRRS